MEHWKIYRVENKCLVKNINKKRYQNECYIVCHKIIKLRIHCVSTFKICDKCIVINFLNSPTSKSSVRRDTAGAAID